MNIKTFLTILAIGFIAISCEKDVEFKGEIINPLVVVNSFTTPDSIIAANVSISRFFLSDTTAFRNINNAEVNLWVNGAWKEKLTFDRNGIYKSTYKPILSDSLKLTVDVPQMKQVSATSNFIDAPIILSVDTQKIAISRRFDWTPSGDTAFVLDHYKVNYKLKFEDNGNQKNYYRLIVRKITFDARRNYNTGKIDTVVSSSPQYIDFDFTDVVSGNATDPLADESTSPVATLLSNTINRYHVFSDDIFNGKTYTLQFSTEIYKYSKRRVDYNGSLSDFRHEVDISLQSISKDYYLYLQTRSASYGTNLFSEPVKVHNNIDGGIGIFGSYTTSNIVKINLD